MTTFRHCIILCAGTLLLAACDVRQPSDVSALPEAKTTEILTVADGETIELNPQIVKKTMNGRTFAFYAYNGQFPGPMLRVQQGSTFTVRVTNGIDQPTSIHWHGLRLDSKSDGAVGLVQDAIEPDGSFTYTVTVPDEGMFWYHPHVREDVQQDLGLYGNILVTPKSQTAYAPVNSEQAIVLDDILLGRDGLPVAYGAEDANYALMGRFGNTMLVNGQVNPTLPAVHKGDTVRFYLTNAANTRTFNIAFAGATMKLVGGDAGRYAREQFVDTVTLAPSERAIVDVHVANAGTVTLQHMEPRTTPLARIDVSADAAGPSYAQQFKTLRTNNDVVADIDAFKPFFARQPDHTVRLSGEAMMGGMRHQGMGMASGSPDGIEWEDTMPHMNAMSTKETTQWKLVDADTGKENMGIDYVFKKGDAVKIRLVNDRESAHPMQHPIHFHGQRFLVVSDNGVENTTLVWKDTVLVPTGHTVDILLDASNPGDWMFHCHIAEHLTNGMMGVFRVQ